MPEICHALTIASGPEPIFEAISTEKGLKGFWTDQTEAEPLVGSVATFRFGPTGKTVFNMQIESLEPPRLVEWRCVDGPEEWKQTRVRWLLSSGNNGTDVSFQHLDWDSIEGELPRCSYTWAMILQRLERYVTQGENCPFFVK